MSKYIGNLEELIKDSPDKMFMIKIIINLSDRSIEEVKVQLEKNGFNIIDIFEKRDPIIITVDGTGRLIDSLAENDMVIKIGLLEL